MTQVTVAYLLVGLAGLWSIRGVIRAASMKLKPVRARAETAGACQDCHCGR